MMTIVIGGSGSGKSEYAEGVAVANGPSDKERFYIATMQPFGSETLAKIARHHELRKNKGFTTMEQYVDVYKAADQVSTESCVLLECMSNLLANEVYRPERREFGLENDQAVVEKVVKDILKLEAACSHLILVTNDIFASGETYDPQTMRYVEMLGQINKRLVKNADTVVEVVCGIPLVIRKKSGKEES